MIFGNLLFFILSATALTLQRRNGPTTDRILAYLESASKEDQRRFLRTAGPEYQARLPDVLELSLFEGQERAFAAFLDYPTLVDWRSSDFAVYAPKRIVSPAKLITILDASTPSLSTLAPQSIQFASFLVANQETLGDLSDQVFHKKARQLIWRGMDWGSLARSSDAVKLLIESPTLAPLIPTSGFQEVLLRSVEKDDLSMFKLLIETESSWARYNADPSVWNALFKKSIGYDFNIPSSQPQRSIVTQYFLESERVMGALPSNIANKIFSTAIQSADHNIMSTFMNNRVAMSHISAHDYNAFVQKMIKNPKNAGGQGMAHLIVSKEESVSRITDEALGNLFVVSAKSGWTTAFDYALTRPDLRDRISSEKFNVGLMTRMKDRTDLAAVRLMLDSEGFLAKMDKRSVGQVFISLVAEQDMAFIQHVLANDNIMIRITANDLYRALNSLVIRNVRPENTATVMRMFMGNAYIARLRDNDLRLLVRSAIKYNRLDSLKAILEQSNIVARLSTSFLRNMEKKAAHNEVKAMILAEIQSRPRNTFAEGFRGMIESIVSHDMRPIREGVPHALPRLRAL